MAIDRKITAMIFSALFLVLCSQLGWPDVFAASASSRLGKSQAGSGIKGLCFLYESR